MAQPARGGRRQRAERGNEVARTRVRLVQRRLMNDETAGGATSEPRKLPTELRFHFVKSSQFRVVHADGAWGGITPQGLISLAAYSERFPIPTTVDHKVDPDGKLGAEVRRTGRDGVLREVEVDLLMSVEVAESFVEFLSRHIKLAKTLRPDPPPTSGGR